MSRQLLASLPLLSALLYVLMANGKVCSAIPVSWQVRRFAFSWWLARVTTDCGYGARRFPAGEPQNDNPSCAGGNGSFCCPCTIPCPCT